MPRGRRGRPVDSLKELAREIEGVLERGLRAVFETNRRMESVLSVLGGATGGQTAPPRGRKPGRRARKIARRRARKLSKKGRAAIAAAARKRWAEFRRKKQQSATA